MADLATRIASALANSAHPKAGDADYGWQLHRPVDGGGHVIVTVQPSTWWQNMPAAAVHTTITRNLTDYADTLTAAGLGTVLWGRGDRHEVLIVADTQDAADQAAPEVIAYLTSINPPTGASS